MNEYTTWVGVQTRVNPNGRREVYYSDAELRLNLAGPLPNVQIDFPSRAFASIKRWLTMAVSCWLMILMLFVWQVWPQAVAAGVRWACTHLALRLLNTVIEISLAAKTNLAFRCASIISTEPEDGSELALIELQDLTLELNHR